MKKKLLALLLALITISVSNNLRAQTASYTVNYTGFQACGGCTVCGSDYWCFNTLSSYCGNTTPCQSTNFTDPCPPGNIVTSVTVNYFSAECSGGSMTATIDGQAVPTVNEANTGCLCSNSPCAQSATSSSNYPCGLPGYVNGGVNTLQMCTGADVCINRIVLVFTYAPANQATPAVAPSAPSGPSPVCVGTAYTYSATSSNAATYTWTVPAGWTINSGQGTSSISATPGSAGNICVTAGNLCGNSAQVCTPVTIDAAPAAPAAPTGSSGCSGSTQIYSTTGSSGATSYNWTVPAGSVINSGQGTTSINVTLGATSGNVCVNASNSCGTSANSCLPITIGGVQATPGAPAGLPTVCNGTTQTYTTSGSAGATSYTWTVPAGSVINSGQGTNSISVTLGSTSGNVCVTATGPCGTSAAACTAVTITTAPLPPASITGTSPVCPGNQNYSISSVAGATSYTWSIAGAGGSITGGQGTTAISTTWASAVTGTVSVTANNSCGASSPATFTVLVNPLPNVSITPTPTAVCPAGTVTLTGNGAVNYSWLGGTVPATGANVTATPISTSTYAVTGTDANNCSNSATVTVTVNPTPTVSISSGASSQTVCAGGTVNGITFTSNPAGTITWTNSNTSLGGPLAVASGSGNIPSYTAPNVSSVTTGVVTINASATGSGCPSTASTQATFTLTINPLPTITASVVTSAPCGQSTGCINSVTASGASPFTYSYDGGSIFTASSSTCSIPSGTYPVQVKDNNGCILSGSIFVPSTSGPAAPTISATTNTACIGDNVSINVTAPVGSFTYTYSDAVGTTTTTSTSYNINGITPAGAYTVNVTATDGSGCVSSNTTTTITVNPAPTAPVLSGSSTNPLVECQNAGQSVSVTPSGTVVSTPVWYSGTVTVGTGNTYTPPSSTPGTFVYTVADSATATGCKDLSAGNILTVTVTVNPMPTGPTLGGGSSNPLVECEGAGQSVTVTPTGTVASIPVWYSGTVTVGTGNTYTPPSTTPGTTVYTVADSATVSGGCVNLSAGNVLTVTVTVNPLPTGPTLGGSSSNPLVECQGAGQSVTVTPTGTVASIPVWYSGTVTVGTGNTYTPPSTTPGTTVYTVADSATTGGCVNLSAGNVLTVTVTVNPSPSGPVLGGGSSNPLVECQGAGQSVTVTPTGTITSIPVWYSGTVTVATGNTYTPPSTTPGTTVYTVADSATVGGCVNLSAGNVLTVTVTVNPMPTGPTLGGGSSNPLVECQGAGQSVSVTPTGTVASIPVWYSGTVTVGSGTTYTPPSTTPGTTVYTVADSATTGGCVNLSAGNVLTVTVTVNPMPTGPTLNAGITNPLVECQGSVAETATVTPTGTVTSIPVWYDGSGATVATGNTYTPSTATPGTTIYTIADSATVGGCVNLSAGNVISLTVTINPSPTAPVISGSATNPLVECQTANLPVTVATTGTVTSIPVWYQGTTYVGSGTTYTPNSSTPGTTVYTVIDSATVTGCKDTSASNVLTVTVTVNAAPVANGAGTADSSYCGNPNGGVSNVAVVSGGVTPYHYQWIDVTTGLPLVGDTLPTLTGVGPGTYSVLITDANGCPSIGGVTQFTVASGVPVVASFTADPTTGTAPLPVTFTNSSTGASGYVWDFGLGTTTSVLTSPSYTYNTSGTYTVMMIASNSGCSDTAYATIIVDVPTTIIIPNVFSPNGDSLNDVFFINCTGMKSLTCDIFNRWGQKVYSLTGPNQTWDGRLNNGHAAAEGTYYYMLVAEGDDGKKYTYQGSLTLVK